MSAPTESRSADGLSRGAAALLRDRTFGPYFWGNLLSNCGTWFHNLAAAVVVYDITGSALLVGLVSVAQFAVTLVLAPYVGAVSDRVDRRRTLLGGQVVAISGAATLAGWTAAVGVEGLPGPWPVIAMTLVIGVGYAISIPAMQALVPALVPRADLDQAIALNTVTFNIARAVGPALAAAALLRFGAATVFAINAASYLALIVALLVISPRPAPRVATGGDGSVREGLRYVLADRNLTLLLLAVAAIGFGADPVNTLTPAIADRLGGGEGLVGLLVSAFGTGAALSALAVDWLRRRVGLARRARAGLALLGAGMVAVGVAGSAPVAAVALALAGSGYLLGLTALTTAIQQRVDEAVRGRVMALWSVAFLGSRPLAAVVDGALADLLSVPVALLAAGAVPLAAAVAVGALRRRHATA